MDNHRTWDEALLILINAYNDSYHTALGCMPSEAFMGRKLGSVPLSAEQPVGEYTQLGWVERLKFIMARTHALIFAKIDEKIAKNDRSSLTDRVATKFVVDQQVLIYRPTIEQESGYKITPHWYGPYTVEGVGSSGRVCGKHSSLHGIIGQKV